MVGLAKRDRRGDGGPDQAARHQVLARLELLRGRAWQDGRAKACVQRNTQRCQRLDLGGDARRDADMGERRFDELAQEMIAARQQHLDALQRGKLERILRPSRQFQRARSNQEEFLPEQRLQARALDRPEAVDQRHIEPA